MTLKINAKYEVKVIDNKTGQVVKTVKGKSKTFTQHFARLLSLYFQRGDVSIIQTVTDLGGAARTFHNNSSVNPFNVSVSAAHKLRLRIGSSGAAFSRTQYELMSLIAAVDYSTHTVTDDGTKVIVDFSGSWINPGASVTVREIGFSVRYLDTGSIVRDILLARDVIPDTVVAPGQTIAVAYSITIPF